MHTQSAFGRLMDAALPPPSAVRLCLTVESLPDTGGCASIHEAKPHEINRIQLRKGGAFPHCAAAEPQNTIIIRMPGGLIQAPDVGRWTLGEYKNNFNGLDEEPLRRLRIVNETLDPPRLIRALRLNRSAALHKK